MDKSEGFWREFFLLRPDPASLRRILADLSAGDLLNLQVLYQNRRTPSSFMLNRLQAQTHQLFSNAVSFVKAGVAPSDEIALDVSLSTRILATPQAYDPDLDSFLRWYSEQEIYQHELGCYHSFGRPGSGRCDIYRVC